MQIIEGQVVSCWPSGVCQNVGKLPEPPSVAGDPKPLLLIGPLRRFAVAALKISVLATALHVVAVQLHRGVCGALLLFHLLHAF